MKGKNGELRIAILGAGIMGCSLALFLARKGARITLIDEASAPFSGASRWNEGKIHLGYLYAGDPSLATARRLLTGGLAFGKLVEELLDSELTAAVSQDDDIFLTHRDSVVDAESMSAYFDKVSELVRQHPDAHRYFDGLTTARSTKLTPLELKDVTASPDIVAGFRVPERSIRTNWLADRFIGAIAAQPLIEPLLNTRIQRVINRDDEWQIVGVPLVRESFDVVINALWHGGPAVDAASGFAHLQDPVSYRYRLSLFLRSERQCVLPNAVVAVGPFGDIKNYNGHDLYFSWYPAGLVVSTEGVDPRVLPIDAEMKAQVATGILRSLQEYFPQVTLIAQEAATLGVAGGWVVAQGKGSLDDPASSLHRRDRFGITRFGSYYTIDTGKYSTAPWLARRLSDEIMS